LVLASCDKDDESVGELTFTSIVGPWELTHFIEFYGTYEEYEDFNYKANKEAYEDDYWIYFYFNTDGTVDVYEYYSSNTYLKRGWYTYTLSNNILKLYENDIDDEEYVSLELTNKSMVILDGPNTGYGGLLSAYWEFLTKRQSLPAEATGDNVIE
jgi:hypothetical protein